jgi:ATP-binding cassette subfamily F protein 3
VLQEAQSAREGASITEIRSILGAFLFNSDDVAKRVRVLSGGEKNRLALVKMLLTPSNLLLLDEPTNHLDMGSRSMLAQALRAYEGAVVLISHDRYFVDEVCDEVWEVAHGRVTPFLGNYSWYLEALSQGRRPGPFPLSAPPPPHPDMLDASETRGARETTPKLTRREQRRKSAEDREARARVLKPLKRVIKRAEAQIAQFEERLAELEVIQCQTDHYEDADAVVRVSREVKELERALEAAMDEWERAEEALAEAEAELE